MRSFRYGRMKTPDIGEITLMRWLTCAACHCAIVAIDEFPILRNSNWMKWVATVFEACTTSDRDWYCQGKKERDQQNKEVTGRPFGKTVSIELLRMKHGIYFCKPILSVITNQSYCGIKKSQCWFWQQEWSNSMSDHADLESDTCRCKFLKWHQHRCQYSWRRRVYVPTLFRLAEFIRFSNPQPSTPHSVVVHTTNEFISVCAGDFCDRTAFSCAAHLCNRCTLRWVYLFLQGYVHSQLHQCGEAK